MDRYSNFDQTACEVQRQSTLTERLSQQLTELNSILTEVHGRLESRYSNIFGPRTMPPEPASQIKGIPTHTAAELTEGVQGAINRAHGLNSLVSDLLTAL